MQMAYAPKVGVVRRRAGEDGGGAGDGDGVRERVLAAAGVLAHSVCGGAGWELSAVFGRLHREGVSACVAAGAGGCGDLFCFFSLADVIAALVVLRIVLQFLMQHVGVMLLRRRRPEMKRPFRMWLYPLPPIVALAGFGYIVFVRRGSASGVDAGGGRGAGGDGGVCGAESS